MYEDNVQILDVDHHHKWRYILRVGIGSVLLNRRYPDDWPAVERAARVVCAKLGLKSFTYGNKTIDL